MHPHHLVCKYIFCGKENLFFTLILISQSDVIQIHNLNGINKTCESFSKNLALLVVSLFFSELPVPVMFDIF